MADINIAGKLHSTATGNVVASSSEIYDDTQGKKQSQVNADVQTALNDRYTKQETYSKTQLDNLITTPSTDYEYYQAEPNDTFSDVLPDVGVAKTIYRAGAWDGVNNQYDAFKFSEYAWDGSNYVFLRTVDSFGDGIFNISQYNATGSTFAEYQDLADALGVNGANLPENLRIGGLAVKYLDSSSHTYKQCRLASSTFTTTESYWISENVDEAPTLGSANLVESGGVFQAIADVSDTAKYLSKAGYDVFAPNKITIRKGHTYLFSVKASDSITSQGVSLKLVQYNDHTTVVKTLASSIIPAPGEGQSAGTWDGEEQKITLLGQNVTDDYEVAIGSLFSAGTTNNVELYVLIEDITYAKSVNDSKQDTISDLATIRSGAAAGATAVQPAGLAAAIADLGIYDVTANNSGATFASLSALLNDAELSTLIPTSVRKGGMSIKFVCSSDNKYVQYRYLSTSTDVVDFTNVDNWEKEIGNKTIDQLLKVIAKGGYIQNNSIGSTATYFESDSYSCEEIPVLVGQKYTVIGTSTNNARLWATLDADRKVVRCSTYDSALKKQETVTIEDGEYYLTYNTGNTSSEKLFQLIEGSVIDFIVKLADYYDSIDKDIYNKIQAIVTKNNELLKVVAKSGYIVNNSIGSKAVYYESSSYNCEEIPVLVGQKYNVIGTSTDSARLWATLDAERKVVRCSTYESNLKKQETVTIEEGEQYLTYNTGTSSSEKVFELIEGSVVDFIVKLADYYDSVDEDIYNKIQALIAKNTEQDDRLNHFDSNLDISEFETGAYIELNSIVSPNNTYSGYVRMCIRVRKGMKFLLTLKGGSGVRAFYTTDNNAITIRKADANVTLNDYEITIEDGEEYLYVSSDTSSSFTPKIVFKQNVGTSIFDAISTAYCNKESLDIIASFYPARTDLITNDMRSTDSPVWEYGSLGTDWYVGGSSTQLVNARPFKLVKGKYLVQGTASNSGYALYDKHFNQIINESLAGSGKIITVSDDFQYLYLNFLASGISGIRIARLSKAKKDVLIDDSDRETIDGVNTVSQSYTDGYSVLNDTTFKTSDFTTEASGKVTPFIPIKKGAKIDVFAWNTTTPNTVQGIRVYKDTEWIRTITFATTSTDGCTVSKTGATHSSASEYKFHFDSDFFDADGMSIKITNNSNYAKLPSIRIVSYESSFVLDKNDVHSDLFMLGDLSSDYSKALPISVDGTAGSPNAKYTISAPLTRFFNIRFKFRITDALINSPKAQAPFWATNTLYHVGDYVWYSSESYKCTVEHTSGNSFDTSKFTKDYINLFTGAGSYIRAIPSQRALSQYTKTYTYNGTSYTSYYGTFNGGISFDTFTNISNRKFLNNIGDFAFSLRYIGSGTSATARNTGSEFILKVDDVEVANLSYSTYTTMAALYKAIAAVDGFEVDYNEIEDRTPQELAIFPESQLISTFYGNLHGLNPTPENSEQYTDNPPLLIPYAVSNKWNQAEIVGVDDKVYVVVNGITSILDRTQTSVAKLVFGGDCGILFKDVEIDLSSVRDAEVVNNYGSNTPMIISSVNPYTMIYEGHGMVDSIIEADSYPGDNMSCSADRIQRVVEESKAKGYVPVSLMDIVEHYKNGTPVPKKCFTFVFDDYRFDNFLDLKNRSVFTRFGLKAALAVISDQNSTISYNGSTITTEKAVAIGKNAGFECYSHTRDHRFLESVRPSEYANEAKLDIYSGDEKGINPNILIFPNGNSNTYLLDILKFIGLEAGVDVAVSSPYCNNPYCLVRQEIGVRENIQNVLRKIV